MEKHFKGRQGYFIGRYGEYFLYTEIEPGRYLISCYEIGLDKDTSEQAIEETELLGYMHRYIEEGVSDFDETTIDSRAVRMGEKLKKHYLRFLEGDDFEKLIYAAKIRQDLLDIELLRLNRTEYVGWFLTHGSTEDKEYLKFMRRAKRWLVDEKTLDKNRSSFMIREKSSR